MQIANGQAVANNPNNQMKYVIIMQKEDQVEAWKSVTRLCDKYKFSYHYMKRLKFPFNYKGYSFRKELIR